MKFKQLAKKAGSGDKKSLEIFVMMVPEGLMPHGVDPKEYARDVHEDDDMEDYELEGDAFLPEDGDEEVDVSGFPDEQLKMSLYDALKPLGLPEEVIKAVCSVVYDGIVSGEIFPEDEDEEEEGNPHPKEDTY